MLSGDVHDGEEDGGHYLAAFSSDRQSEKGCRLPVLALSRPRESIMRSPKLCLSQGTLRVVNEIVAQYISSLRVVVDILMAERRADVQKLQEYEPGTTGNSY